jgi:hypothetical protein
MMTRTGIKWESGFELCLIWRGRKKSGISLYAGQAGRREFAEPIMKSGCALILLTAAATLLFLPVMVRAQFDFATNNGSITITSYIGSGGDVTIPSTTNGLLVTSIGYTAFYDCDSVTCVTIPSTVTSIGNEAFDLCSSLNSVTIGSGVTKIGSYAFYACFSLNNVFFQGNAPSNDATLFADDSNVTVYYLPGTTGWGADFGDFPTMLWNPQVQTGNASFGVLINQFGFNITGSSNLMIVVEACANLANPVWTPLETNTLTGGVSDVADPQWTNYPERFYRFRSP